MKNNLLKYYLVAFCFCSTLGLLAQPGSTGDGNGGVEGTDAPAAAIDDHVWVITLILIGVIYVFMKFKNIQVRALTAKDRL
jgi:hypothetical protein